MQDDGVPSSPAQTLTVKILSPGVGRGDLVHSGAGISFWGGVDPRTGMIVDRHHPLCGQSVAGRILAIPGGRGSCSGSGVLMELISNGHGPAGIIVCEREEILTLGALVSDLLFGLPMPRVQVSPETFAAIGGFAHARIDGDRLDLSNDRFRVDEPGIGASRPAPEAAALALARLDQDLLAGAHGKAAQMAMQLLVRMAGIYGADAFVDVSQVHVDGCIYTGPASLRFAQQLVAWGAAVRVPTTLNAISVDRRRWRELGVDEAFGAPAAALADAYVAMGARPSFTCAPYLLDTAPSLGEQIGWAESNAVVYANSVLGARTMKYPDYLDICIALTGRAPLASCHLDAGRRATIALDVVRPAGADDAFWPLLGYCCGLAASSEIPLIRGLEASAADSDALKAFGAAFATVSAAPMFHIAGVTPEAGAQRPGRSTTIGIDGLRAAWRELDASTEERIGLVSLGNPHFSLSEFQRLASLVQGRSKSPDVGVVVTCGRAVHDAASRAGHTAELERFGMRIVTDTCWCMIGEPIVPAHVTTIMTNSGKYAHYAPGLVGRQIRFGSLAACVEAASSGRLARAPPAWL